MKKFIKIIAIMLVMTVCTSMVGQGTYVGKINEVKAATNKKAKIKLNKKKATVRVGEVITLKLKKAKAKKVKWSSSKKKVAKVKKGVVTALKKGKTTITAKYKNKKYKCKLTVKEALKKDVENNPNSSVPTVVDIKTLTQSEYLIDNLYDNQNIIVSPASLNMVIGMVANGAIDSVKLDCEKYLGTSLEDYNKYSANLMSRDQSDEMIKLTNGVWYKQDYTINQTFNNAIINSYKATVKPSLLDQTTVTEINQWASDNTDGMIKKIINEIPEATVAILANALLFDGKWTSPFKGYRTYDDTFTKFDNTTIQVPMMHDSERVYYENDDAIGFEKTYGKNKEYSFIAILPKKKGEFSLSKLELGTFLGSKTNEYKVNISMPKFTYSWDSTLNDVLLTTELKTLFDDKIYPLANILDTTESVYLSAVLQSCKIIVDEEGTKAAAVTAGIIEATGAIIDKTPVKTVELDRPFGYIIMDNTANEVLFMGKVVEPTQE